jgi:hypothetical protein
MKSFTLSALAISVAVVGFSGSAGAQTAHKLFFEGDIVRHALKDQQGPFCVLNNQYKRGEAVAWRIRVLDDSGPLDGKGLKSVVVQLGNGQTLPAHFGGHGMPPTDHFWSLNWVVPKDFPTGSLGYKVVATMNDGTSQTWEPFTRDSTQLTVIPGDPIMAAAAAPTP